MPTFSIDPLKTRELACSLCPYCERRARKKYRAVAVATATDIGVHEYRFVRRYLERRPHPHMFLRQIDPLIRQLTASRMNLIELNRALRQLRLGGMAAVLETRLRQAQAEPIAPIDFLSCLVSDEPTRRGDRLLERRPLYARGANQGA